MPPPTTKSSRPSALKSATAIAKERGAGPADRQELVRAAPDLGERATDVLQNDDLGLAAVLVDPRADGVEIPVPVEVAEPLEWRAGHRQDRHRRVQRGLGLLGREHGRRRRERDDGEDHG